ncbi:heparan-alpha-glucosaminide N-acetyltransferase domain-containing protein [Anaerococcus rubeinfantis]|uniref:heparan-alpha-glucosaminide N-acetyltransferase domain-containing protein n=1 Tax=Anaerococcus rubeinfantis TaxID=1720199 RepID=UPI00073F122A|nr:heparan-alpha-glucosaminide N-acetyltransferase domain-containing protein [Anaerococcus rubeinfantis]
MKRNYILDKFRGFTIISMVLFHLFYDISLYKDLLWYNNFYINKIWQLSIAISFFIISGISSNFLDWKKNLKRGIIISLLGILISLITYFFIPDQLIIFGVLNGLGLSMVLISFVQKYLKISNKLLPIFVLLFILTYNLANQKILYLAINSILYEKNLFILGFPSKTFHSTDYFPIIPWFFAYISGYIFGKILIENNFYNKYGRNSTLAKIGQNSLKIYILHQVIIYGLVYFIFEII